MQLRVDDHVRNRIKQFYYNATLKYPNTYFPDNADRDIDKVLAELPKVGTPQLQHRNYCIIQRWKNYLVDYSKATNWYFAYRKFTNGDTTIYVMDAENARNMSDLAIIHL